MERWEMQSVCWEVQLTLRTFYLVLTVRITLLTSSCAQKCLPSRNLASFAKDPSESWTVG